MSHTISTIEELDALPEQSCVWSNTVYLRVKSARGRLIWGCVGTSEILDNSDIPLPAEVIHQPGVTV